MGNSSSTPKSLDPKTMQIEERNGTSYILTQSNSEFAHFCTLLDAVDEIQGKIISGYYKVSEDSSDSDEYDSEECGKYVSGKNSSTEEEEDSKTEVLDINNASKKTIKGHTIEEEFPFCNNNTAPESTTIRNRTRQPKYINESNLPNVSGKDNTDWLRIDNEQIYKAFILFKLLRGMDGTLIFTLKNNYNSSTKNKDDKNTPDLHTKEKINSGTNEIQGLIENEEKKENCLIKEKDLFLWCKKNFGTTLEIATLNNDCIDKCYSFFTSLSKIFPHQKSDF